MEKKYESLTLLEFQRQFPDDKACYDYLAEMKWPWWVQMRAMRSHPNGSRSTGRRPQRA